MDPDAPPPRPKAKHKRSPKPKSSASEPLLPPPVATPPKAEDGKELSVDSKKRFLCGAVCIGGVVVFFVLKALVTWLLNHHGGGSAGPPPSGPEEATENTMWPSAACDIPVHEYSVNPAVVDQCKTEQDWAQMAGISVLNDGDCYINSTTDEIECKRHESCQGGQKQMHEWSTMARNLTYDCGAQCHGTLRVNCCKTCNSIQGSNLDYHAVNCQGCDEDELAAIVSQNTAQCSLTADGLFYCESKDNCQVKPVVTQAQVTHSLSCSITPCNVCKTPQLQSKCCSICTASLCNSPKGRQVCQGCSSRELADVQRIQASHGASTPPPPAPPQLL